MSRAVSILVPVYNVSNYIERCAHSLFQQTFSDIEYLFVDDASSDDSMVKLAKVIDQYPDLEKQIFIFRLPVNQGTAVTRNTAIERSTGKYILFVDSDDYIEPEMVELLYKKAVEESADIVASDTIMMLSGETRIVSDVISCDKEENFVNILKHDCVSASLWNKLIIRTLYENEQCRLIEGLNYSEDWYLMIRLFYFAAKIVKVDRAFYHYTQENENSITRTTKKEMHFKNTLFFWESLDEFLHERNIRWKYSEIIALGKVRSKIKLMVGTTSQTLRKKYALMFLEEEKQYISFFTMKERFMLFLIRHNFFVLTGLYRKFMMFV